MKCIFNNHSLKTKENLLWGYAEATLSYIYQEKVNQPILLNTKFSDDFNLSVDSNHFNRMTKVSR
ncbi:hypothetical protein VNTUMSATTG_44890 [Vibrio nigripulchritudo]|nr:hypothetical protein VNTUMSATTG_44890 [Vibrio nigripulchritudo]